MRRRSAGPNGQDECTRHRATAPRNRGGGTSPESRGRARTMRSRLPRPVRTGSVWRARFRSWGRLDAAFRLPPVDGLLVATARVHQLFFVTRNTRDVARTGVARLNPFEP